MQQSAQSGGWVAGTRSLGSANYSNSISACPIEPACAAGAKQTITYDIAPGYSRLTGMLGVEDARSPEQAIFVIFLDDIEKYVSGTVGDGVVQPLDLPLNGAKKLRIEAQATSTTGMLFVCGDCRLS